MPGPMDATLKALVEASPAAWPALIGRPAAAATLIDADVSAVSGAADKVLRVRSTLEWLLHLEFQAGHDSARLPPRLHWYNALLDDRHGLPVHSVAVLLRPEADSPQLTGVYRRQFPGEPPHLTFRYQVLRVWRLPAETLLGGGLGTLPLAPISAVAEAELPGVVGRMKERLARERDRRRVNTLWGATYILLGLRYSDAVAEQLLQGVVRMKESATYQAILREGRAEGVIKGMKELVVILGQDRFGAAPGARARAALNAIADETQLKALSMRLLHVKDWDELLELPPPTGSARKRKPSS